MDIKLWEQKQEEERLLKAKNARVSFTTYANSSSVRLSFDGPLSLNISWASNSFLSLVFYDYENDDGGVAASYFLTQDKRIKKNKNTSSRGIDAVKDYITAHKEGYQLNESLHFTYSNGYATFIRVYIDFFKEIVFIKFKKEEFVVRGLMFTALIYACNNERKQIPKVVDLKKSRQWYEPLKYLSECE